MSDGRWVCVHNWPLFYGFAGRQFEAGAAAPNWAEYANLKGRMPFTPCALEDLPAWLANHPGARIVTDTKADNRPLLRAVAQALPKERVIVQVYHPKMIAVARDMGFEDVILTVYKLDWPNNHIAKAIKGESIFALTMPKKRVLTGLARHAARDGHRVYTHTVNACTQFKFLRLFGVEEIYSDDLVPGLCDSTHPRYSPWRW